MNEGRRSKHALLESAMNKDWIVFHLDEARAVLTQLRERVASDSLDSMQEADLGTSIAEAWGHLNAAWSGRNDSQLTPERLGDLSDAEFRRLRSTLTDITPI